MRHRKSTKKLGRTTSHRKALTSNVATALFQHKQIRTTTPKAKAIKRTVERLITYAKRGTLADRRQVLRTIHDKKVVQTLFEEIAPTYQDRNGGYTRVIRLGRRKGDGAEIALLELVGYEGVLIDKQRSKEEAKSAKEKKKKEAEKEKEDSSEK